MVNVKYFVIPDKTVWSYIAEDYETVKFESVFQNLKGITERVLKDDELYGIFDLSSGNAPEIYMSENHSEISKIIAGNHGKYKIRYVGVYSDGSIGFGFEENGIFSSTVILQNAFCPGFIIDTDDNTRTKYIITVDEAYGEDRKTYYKTKIIEEQFDKKYHIYETCRRDGKEMLEVTICE